MDGYDFINKLCEKLLKPIQQQWIGQVGKSRDREFRSPVLDDFETFVSRLARNENDPRICGLGYQNTNSYQGQTHTNPKRPNPSLKKSL